MNKKNISIITISLIILLSVGIGFNKLFSTAQKNDNNKSETIISVSSNIENDESNNKEYENKEVEESDKTNENKEVEDSNKDNENKEVEKSEIASDKEYNKKESENSNVSNESTKSSDEATAKPNNTTIKPSDESTKPSNDKVEETTQAKPQSQTVTIAISCKTAINNGLNSQPGFTHLPSNGTILSTMEVELKDGDTVFDVLVRATRQKGIHM